MTARLKLDALLAALLILLAAASARPLEAAETLSARLKGTWDGWGTIRLADGTSDKMRCRAQFSGSAGSISERLSCQGRSYRIEGTGTFLISGGSVAEKNRVCRIRGRHETMRSTSGMKPMSSMRSASSMTRISTPVSNSLPRWK